MTSATTKRPVALRTPNASLHHPQMRSLTRHTPRDVQPARQSRGLLSLKTTAGFGPGHSKIDHGDRPHGRVLPSQRHHCPHRRGAGAPSRRCRQGIRHEGGPQQRHHRRPGQAPRVGHGGRGQPHGEGGTHRGRRTVPTGFRIDAYGTFEDGTPGLDIDGVFISNTLGGRNLGMFNDPNTGRQVPTGSMS